MHRSTLLFATLIALSATSAGAETRHKPRHIAKPHAVEDRAAASIPAASATRPRWAAPQQCFTDDGYGRFTPCEGGGKGY